MKIDATSRRVKADDETLITAIEVMASSSAKFTLSEVALGYVARGVEALSVSLITRHRDGGFSDRTLTLATNRSVTENLLIIDKYLDVE